jgi:hypothetical protein
MLRLAARRCAIRWGARARSGRDSEDERVDARFARFVLLVSGAAILVVETLATRLVAPYVGLTLDGLNRSPSRPRTA